MQRPVKKVNSRDAFAAVFEKQTRRFSAFELLGLSAEHPSHTSQIAQDSQAVKEDNLLLAKKARQNISKAEVLVPDGQGEVLLPDHNQTKNKSHSKAEVLVPDGQGEVLVRYSPTQALTVDPQYLGLTVRSDLGLTPPVLGPDGQVLVRSGSHSPKLLAPLQWAVWCVLQRIEASAQTVSYRQIAQETNATADGVKKAINIIQKEGGIIKREVVRSAKEQGFRVILNHEVLFRAATLNEAKGVLKRGLNMGLTGGGQVKALLPDGQRMSVCNNKKQTDIDALLRIPPLEWKIREQTLIQIADALPDMTAIEFRLSLNYLVEQEKKAKEPIRNHNAWIKAAFEKNKGPLVTEREIEVRFQQASLKREMPKPHNNRQDRNSDSELFRLYLASSPDERTQIDFIAETKAAPLLKIVSEDKREGVIEEARREAAREFLLKRS